MMPDADALRSRGAGGSRASGHAAEAAGGDAPRRLSLASSPQGGAAAAWLPEHLSSSWAAQPQGPPHCAGRVSGPHRWPGPWQEAAGSAGSVLKPRFAQGCDLDCWPDSSRLRVGATGDRRKRLCGACGAAPTATVTRSPTPLAWAPPSGSGSREGRRAAPGPGWPRTGRAEEPSPANGRRLWAVTLRTLPSPRSWWFCELGPAGGARLRAEVAPGQGAAWNSPRAGPRRGPLISARLPGARHRGDSRGGAAGPSSGAWLLRPPTGACTGGQRGSREAASAPSQLRTRHPRPSVSSGFGRHLTAATMATRVTQERRTRWHSGFWNFLHYDPRFSILKNA